MPPKPPRVALDPERIVAVAVEIADADGLGAVTLARISAALGVRAPSLYNHVAGLDGVLRGVALRGLRELGEALTAAAVGRSGPEALTAAAHAYRAYATAHPGAYAATQGVSADADDEFREAQRRTTEVLFAVLRHWPLGDEDLIHATRAIRSALHGFTTLETGGGFGLPVDLDRSFAQVVTVQIAGLDALAGR